MTAVWIYVDTNKDVGDPDLLQKPLMNGSRTTIPRALFLDMRL
jgi:hypothetical protein